MKLKKVWLPALAAAMLSASAHAAEWQLSFDAEFSAWGPDLNTYPLTSLRATVLTEDELSITADGAGYRVLDISGTLNGQAISGLWTATDGAFFGGWTPSPFVLPTQAQQVTYDGIAFLTADGVQHVLYGSTFSFGGIPEVQYWTMSDLPTSNPYSAFLAMGGTTLTLAPVPEPASWALMLAGGAALLARRRSLAAA